MKSNVTLTTLVLGTTIANIGVAYLLKKGTKLLKQSQKQIIKFLDNVE